MKNPKKISMWKYSYGLNDFVSNIKEFGLKESLKHDVERTWEKYRGPVSLTAGLVSLAAAINVASLAVSTPIFAAFNGLERVVGGETKKENMFLESKENFLTHYGDKIYMGIFRREDGTRIQLADMPDIPTGKMFANWDVAPKNVETGKTYEVTYMKGPISQKVIDLEEVK